MGVDEKYEIRHLTVAENALDWRRLLHDLDGRLAFVKAISGYGDSEAR
jgi:hypothetical protein